MTTFSTLDSTPDEIIFPPSDLYSKEPPLETYAHLKQIFLLLTGLEWLWQDRNDYFAAGNLTIYYSPNQKKSEDFRGPDFFVVLGTERRLDRKSWVVWAEGGKYPDIIVEILSNSTATFDRTEKKQIYQDIFRTPDYFWFDPETLEFQGFRLVEGQYQPIEPTEQGQLWSDRLELFLGIHQEQLRFFTADGQLVPTPEEAALLASRQLDLASRQLENERQEKERLQAKLRAFGIDPD
jgi:Uma2 family endonuclease